jgi:hypothetical protein
VESAGYSEVNLGGFFFEICQVSFFGVWTETSRQLKVIDHEITVYAHGIATS